MSWAYSAGFRWLPNPKRKINSLAHSKLVLVARKLRQMILELVGGLHKRFSITSKKLAASHAQT